MSFKKYQSLERLGTQTTEGILEGIVYAFYKIDGTNASLWFDGRIRGGSRNRELDIENDNAGFLNWALKQHKFEAFFKHNPNFTLYGEWLVPHSLKTYRDSAWREFYVFDVVNNLTGEYLVYEDYKELLETFAINYIPPLAIFKMPSREDIYKALDKTGQFLVKDGEGNGEGLVLKNYEYKNKYGDRIWAKVISNEFKEIHHKEMGAPLINNTISAEERAVEYATEAFFEKEKAKLILEEGEWNNKLIPKFIGVTWHTFLKEETPHFVSNLKRPQINFAFLQMLFIKKAKKVLGL